jgi:ribosomal protein S18 acetylase RimI-like enzyme
MEKQATTASSTPFHTSSLPWKYYHNAALTIADAFQEDPLFIKGSPYPRTRFVLTYAIAASQIGSGSSFADMLSSNDIVGAAAAAAAGGTSSTSTTQQQTNNNTKFHDNDQEQGDDHDGTTTSPCVNPVQCVCLWEKTKDDFILGTFELVLKNLIMAFSIYFYLIKGAACTVGYHKQVGAVINSVLVILYSVCTLWILRFLFELFRFMFVYTYMVAKGAQFKSKYEKDQGAPLGKRSKHLSMVGTLAASRGQGAGSALMRYTLKKHDDSNLYDYYYLESSNPKNVPFYERHGFVVTGDIKIIGEKATFMIRKKPTLMN